LTNVWNTYVSDYILESKHFGGPDFQG